MMQRRSAAGGNAADADANPGVESDGARSSDAFADGTLDPNAVAEHALALVPVNKSRSAPPVEVPSVEVMDGPVGRPQVFGPQSTYSNSTPPSLLVRQGPN